MLVRTATMRNHPLTWPINDPSSWVRNLFSISLLSSVRLFAVNHCVSYRFIVFVDNGSHPNFVSSRRKLCKVFHTHQANRPLCIFFRKLLSPWRPSWSLHTDSQCTRRNWLFFCSLRRFARCHTDTTSLWCSLRTLSPLGSCLYHAIQLSPIGPIPFPNSECLYFLLQYNADTSCSCLHRIQLISYLPSYHSATVNCREPVVRVFEVP